MPAVATTRCHALQSLNRNAGHDVAPNLSANVMNVLQQWPRMPNIQIISMTMYQMIPTTAANRVRSSSASNGRNTANPNTRIPYFLMSLTWLLRSIDPSLGGKLASRFGVHLSLLPRLLLLALRTGSVSSDSVESDGYPKWKC